MSSESCSLTRSFARSSSRSYSDNPSIPAKVSFRSAGLLVVNLSAWPWSRKALFTKVSYSIRRRCWSCRSESPTDPTVNERYPSPVFTWRSTIVAAFRLLAFFEYFLITRWSVSLASKSRVTSISVWPWYTSSSGDAPPCPYRLPRAQPQRAQVIASNKADFPLPLSPERHATWIPYRSSSVSPW